MKAKVLVWLAMIGMVVLVFACGCNDSSSGSAYSSGPQTAGEGSNLKSATDTPTTTPGTVAGGTATGGATSTTGAVGQ